MAFEYGSQQLQIKNPFSFQGKLILLSGIVFFILGIILFFVISSRGDEIVFGSGNDRMVLFYHFIGAIILTGAGIFMTVKGLFMVYKFYVGRGIPADLAAEITKSQADYASNPDSIAYTAEDLHKALINRMNPSFTEPSGLLPRLLHTFNPRLLYLPLQLRNITQTAFECAAYITMILVLFLLSMLSGMMGINEFTSTPIWKYIGWVYVFIMLYICYSKFPGKNPGLFRKTSIKKLIVLITFSILVPVISGFINGASEISASPIPWLTGFSGLSIFVFLYIYFLSVKRLPKDNPKTEVSEFRDQWEEAVSPQEMFRNVDMTLADYRYIEISNRKYRYVDTGLDAYEKGDYSGSMIQETQPIPLTEINNSSIKDPHKILCALSGQVLIVLSGLWFFRIIAFSEPANVTKFQTFSSLVGIFMLYYFGSILSKAAHTFLGEVRFKSHLIHFFADGTFNKSKISVGMSVYDSVRSENELVKTSIRPWIVCAEITTTTFATSGHYNLEQYRLILELNKDDSWLESIITTLKKYLKERRKIADTVSTADMETTIRMAQINQVIRNGNNQSDGDIKQMEHNITDIMNDDVKKNYE